jgi:acyl dehydratase
MSQGLEFPVDRTAILNFAGALGESNRIYYDEAYAEQTLLGGVIAPPTFVMASAHWNPWSVFKGVRKIPAPTPEEEEARKRQAEERAAEGAGRAADLSRLLHGEQRFAYHKPIRPGMTLTVTGRPGRSWEKQGRRGGLMKFSETITEYRDENGELVVTAASVGIVTEKAVE